VYSSQKLDVKDKNGQTNMIHFDGQSPSGFTASSYTGMGEYNTEHSQDNISDQGQNDHPDSANVENDDSTPASDGSVNYSKICARSFLYELKY